jgi:uroporphyrinogen decarboxylase
MSMTPRENLLSLYRRQGYTNAPVGFHLCPSLEQEFTRRYPNSDDYMQQFEMPHRIIYDPGFAWTFDAKWRVPGRDKIDWHTFYPEGFRRDVQFDLWGVAHEKGSEAAMHMTRMHHPMKPFDSVDQMEAYPWPDFDRTDFSYLHGEVEAIHAQDLAVFVWAECTIWETAWYLRSMDELMIDMAMDNPRAVYLLDKITDFACLRAAKFAEADVDILGLGDDIGMQSSIMMTTAMYQTWLKPRMSRVIQAARQIKPDIVISYHSCGFIEPFIDDLIEIGVDVLNPVQPESMDFIEIHRKHADRISFSGTLGTQKLMPLGTPEQIRAEVFRNLDAVGSRGGLFCCPTHMLEPETPWENVEAYVRACRDYRP